MNLRRRVWQSAFLATILFVTVAAVAAPDNSRALRANALNVSMVQLIANPKSYDGRLIRVHGYINLAFEGSAIYLHKEDYEHGIRNNGLWLNSSGCKGLDGKPFKAGYAAVIGTFDAEDRGHLGMWSGAISAKICEAWPSRAR